jgi:molybdate transport system regulatory protein
MILPRRGLPMQVEGCASQPLERATLKSPRAGRPGAPPALRLRPRIYRGADIALGPGKIELLEAIEASGSIRQAAAQLDMSYMRAWSLVRTMNGCFATPLVRAVRGGAQGGSAELTEAGRQALALYRRIVRDGTRAAQPAWKQMQPLFATSTPPPRRAARRSRPARRSP